MIKNEKKTMRKDMISKRKLLSKNEVETKSSAILENLKSLHLMENAEHIMIYMDFRNEVKTFEFINYMKSLNKKIYIPRVNTQTNQLDTYLIESSSDLILSDYGILEPSPEMNPSDATIIDLIISPGVAFTRNCDRLGYGAGFYDRFLIRTKDNVITAALSFSMQIVESLPVEDHDQRLNYVITEDTIYSK
ncbi:MAG: 5-formyltetrahydrofolate cyclo-ligase [Acidaminobacteraceae bacterium]